MQRRTINCSNIPPNDPLPFSNSFEIGPWRQYKKSFLVYFELNVFCFLHVNRNLSFIIRIHFLCTKLLSGPIAKYFISASPPVRAGGCEGISDYWKTLNPVNSFSGKYCMDECTDLKV